MKATLSFAFSVLGVSALCAAPEVFVTSTEQAAGTRTVTINYTLSGEAAVTTLYAETNTMEDASGEWVSIGDENVTHATGDINRRVDTGTHTITWHPDKSWPGHKITGGAFRVGVKAWSLSAPPDYMVVDLDGTNVVRYYSCVGQLPGGLADKQYRTRKLVMRKIPAAGVEWRMGQPESERSGLSSCLGFTGNVTLSEDYYMAIYKLTSYQFYLISGRADFSNRGIGILNAWGEPIDETPARKIAWLCARSEFNSNSDEAAYKWPQSGHTVRNTSLLGMLRSLSGIEFDLPTEAQWEYAFRAGEADACYLGGLCTQEKIESLGWTNANNVKTIDGTEVTCNDHPVGQKLPNNWGLYDMCGNGREWCLDYWSEDSTAMLGTDPVGATSDGSNRRVTRTGGAGKSWSDIALSRAGYVRNIQDDTFSVRFACPVTVPDTATN